MKRILFVLLAVAFMFTAYSCTKTPGGHETQSTETVGTSGTSQTPESTGATPGASTAPETTVPVSSTKGTEAEEYVSEEDSMYPSQPGFYIVKGVERESAEKLVTYFNIKPGVYSIDHDGRYRIYVCKNGDIVRVTLNTDGKEIYAGENVYALTDKIYALTSDFKYYIFSNGYSYDKKQTDYTLGDYYGDQRAYYYQKLTLCGDLGSEYFCELSYNTEYSTFESVVSTLLMKDITMRGFGDVYAEELSDSSVFEMSGFTRYGGGWVSDLGAADISSKRNLTYTTIDLDEKIAYTRLICDNSEAAFASGTPYAVTTREVEFIVNDVTESEILGLISRVQTLGVIRTSSSTDEGNKYWSGKLDVTNRELNPTAENVYDLFDISWMSDPGNAFDNYFKMVITYCIVND